MPDAAEFDGRPLPQLCPTGNAQTRRAGNRRARHEINGDGNLLKSGTVTAVECLHYALNLPVSVVITGCESMERLDQAMEAAAHSGRWIRPEYPLCSRRRGPLP